MAVRYEQDVADGCVAFGDPNRRVVEAGAYIVDQSVQPLRHLRGCLAPWTSIAPDVPDGLSGFFSAFFDLGAGDALVFSVVPFPDVFCDLHFGVCADVEGVVSLVLPGEFVAAADVEEFEGAAGAVAGGYVAGSGEERC